MRFAHWMVFRIWMIALLCLSSGCKETEGETPQRVHVDPKIKTGNSMAPVGTAPVGTAPVGTALKSVSQAYFGSTSFKPLDAGVDVEPLHKGSVVLVVFDALNAKHLGAYGYARNTSPHIDGVAQNGLVLMNHVSNSSWTRPSFTTIITGLPKREHKVELKGGWRLEPHIKTLAERFRRQGYRTAGITGNPLVRKAWGFDQGFVLFEDPITLNVKAFPRDRLLVNRAIRWLESIGDQRPFFLVLFLTSSHPPYRPPEKPGQFLSTLPAGDIIEHPFKEYMEPLPILDHQRIVAAYDDEIAYMDGQVGRFLEYLRSSGRMDKTIIAMTADHGEVFGDHNCYLHAYHMWEPVLRVPFILRAPNLPLEGVYDERPFTHLDVAPTLLDLVGIPYNPEELSGISVVKALGDLSLNRERIVFSQHNAHGVRRQAIRKGRWKVIHHHKVDERAARDLDELHPSVIQPSPKDLPTLAWDEERYEFYDLSRDVREENNLFDSRENSPEFWTLLNALRPHVDGEVSPGELTEEMVRALENAGYLRTSPETPPKTDNH